ncbi:MAG: outer membrane protein assembly factor BamA [Deltaproteobacteria bacterium]|jgi:outer membrane protein insertion porin family|nr:outer membrane protein assembly factor BamA [Deltaproteobacteria bacterium]
MRTIKAFVCLSAFLLISSRGFPLSAQEGQKVAITPYAITGVTGTQLENIANITQGLMGVTVRSFSSQGFTPITMSGQSLSAISSAVQVQARELGADYLFAPSLTKIEDSFTVAGQLVALTPAAKSSQRMDVMATQLGALDQTAERLVILVTDHLFGTGARVVSVSLAGSSMQESAALLNSLRIRQGGTYNDAKVASDIRRLYSLGYFETVEVETTDVPGGKSVRFLVTERPQIIRIQYEGNEKYDDDDLNDVVGIKIMDVSSDDKLLQAVANLQRFYAEKGYSQARITHELVPSADGKATLLFRISEGGKLFIDNVIFTGNEVFNHWRLKRVIDSGSKGLFSFISGSGKLDREKLNNDAQLLLVFYKNRGFLEARIGEPEVVPSRRANGYDVIFPIMEGRRFKVGEVTLAGNTLPDDNIPALLKRLDTPEDKFVSQEVMMNDQNRLLAHYKDLGHYYAEVMPNFREPTEDNVLDISFVVEPRNLVYYDRITIMGNETTRDKVIRRHLEVAEGDLTSQTKLIDSQNNLMRSSFFEDVNISPSPSNRNQNDLINLQVQVKERPTGAFQIGAGYSNYSSLFGTVRLSQDNLFGYGRRVALDANVGGNYNYFDFSFTDPWVGDKPLMMGVDIFKGYNVYDYYSKETLGGAIRAGYPVFERFYLSGSYTWEDVDIFDVSIDSSEYLKSMIGRSRNSIANVTLRRDTRNHFFQPTAGSTARVSASLASSFLGGQTSFTRLELEGAKWIPLPIWKGAAFMGHFQLGYLVANKTDGLPMYEKYMIGGINSLRGYDWYEVSPRDPLTNENIGGEKMALANLEFSFPLIPSSGLFGVLFFDVGNVWAKDERYFSSFKKSFGGGLRYLSPMGPLRIEWGRAMDPYPGEPNSRWEFSMGAMF